MSKLDLYSTYLNMEKEDIILSFKGDITKDLLSSVYQIVEARMDIDNEDQKRKKKFYHVLVECLQNMYHHMETLQENKRSTEHGDPAGSAIFMIGRAENKSYVIMTGNFILSENADGLRERIDKINAMSSTELKAYYLEKLGSTELSDKGGAGLGIIDIARKSGNKIDYDLKALDGYYTFFTLSATIN